MSTFDQNKEYPADTLGYHYSNARAVFGEDSPAVKYLQEKADQSSKGFDSEVIVPEPQVVYLLGQIHFRGK